jgi:hypothetical protein
MVAIGGGLSTVTTWTPALVVKIPDCVYTEVEMTVVIMFDGSAVAFCWEDETGSSTLLMIDAAVSSVSFFFGFSMYVRLFGVRLDVIDGVAATVEAEEAVVDEEEEDMELPVEGNTVSKTVTSSTEVTCRRSKAGRP